MIEGQTDGMTDGPWMDGRTILASIIMTFYEKISTLAAAKEQKDMINKIDKLKILPYWRKRIL